MERINGIESIPNDAKPILGVKESESIHPSDILVTSDGSFDYSRAGQKFLGKLPEKGRYRVGATVVIYYP